MHGARNCGVSDLAISSGLQGWKLGKIGEGMVGFYLLFRFQFTVQSFNKIDWELRPYERWQTDRHTDASDFIICLMLCSFFLLLIFVNADSPAYPLECLNDVCRGQCRGVVSWVPAVHAGSSPAYGWGTARMRPWVDRRLFVWTAKPGVCPRVPSNLTGVACKPIDECTYDADCSSDRKCCSNGCRLTCQQPGRSIVITH